MPRMEAKPEPVELDLTRSAVVVVDMQNAFANKGGTLDMKRLLRILGEVPRTFQQLSVNWSMEIVTQENELR